MTHWSNWLLVFVLCGVPRLANAQKISPEAERQFDAGVELLDDPDGPRYAEAYKAFSAAYESSKSPLILGNLGLCAMKLERVGEALEAFRGYLAEADRVSKQERAQITRDMNVLQARAATMVVANLEPDMVIVDERIPDHGASVINRYVDFDGTAATIDVRAGRHRVSVEQNGASIWSEEIRLEPHERKEVAVVVADPEDKSVVVEPDAPFPMIAVVLSGVTGALGVVTAITGGLALSRQSEFEALNNGTDPALASTVRDDGIALNITTDVFLGTTLVAAGFATAMWILWFTEDDSETGWVPFVTPSRQGGFEGGVIGRF